MSALHVVFRVGSADYALPAADVLQMESFEGATPVPNAPPYLAGIVQVRGRVIPVIDMRARFGLPAAERTIDSRIVVAQLEERVMGLLVDTAREVAHLDPEHVKAPPSMVAQQSGGMVRAIGQHAGRMVMLIDLEKLMAEEQIHAE